MQEWKLRSWYSSSSSGCRQMAKGKMKKNICVFRDKMPPFYISSRMFVQQKIDMYRNKWHLFIKYLLIEIPSRKITFALTICIYIKIFFWLNTKEFIMDYLIQLGHVVINSRCLVTICHEKTSRTRQTRKIKSSRNNV